MINREHTEFNGNKSKINTSVSAVTKGILESYVILAILFFIIALAYTYTPFPSKFLTPCVSALTVLSLVLCGLFAARAIQYCGWLHGALAGFFYTAIRYIFSALFLNGFGFNTAVISMFLLGTFFGAVGGILGINLKR